MTAEKFYAKAENIGKNCQYWDNMSGCNYPKAELEGRRSCEGIIDDVCLFIIDGRLPQSLTQNQIVQIKTSAPSASRNINLPPGDIV